MPEFQIHLRNDNHRLYDRFAILLLLLSVTAIFFNKWFAAAMFLLFIFYFLSKKKLNVIIDPKGITYPSFPQRHLAWKSLSNVMLKHGLLTIDFKNNRIIQQYVDEVQTRVNEEEFNEFCSQQLN